MKKYLILLLTGVALTVTSVSAKYIQQKTITVEVHFETLPADHLLQSIEETKQTETADVPEQTENPDITEETAPEQERSDTNQDPSVQDLTDHDKSHDASIEPETPDYDDQKQEHISEYDSESSESLLNLSDPSPLQDQPDQALPENEHQQEDEQTDIPIAHFTD